MKFLRNLALLLVCTASAAHAQTPVVVQIDLEDTIQPVSAGYVKDGLNHAKDVNARAVILRLNTPGGLVDSMREIVEAILSSPVPVITCQGRKKPARWWIFLVRNSMSSVATPTPSP